MRESVLKEETSMFETHKKEIKRFREADGKTDHVRGRENLLEEIETDMLEKIRLSLK